MIFVFISNKLISCDSVLPFCLSIKQRFPHQQFVFYTTDDRTFSFIKEQPVLDGTIDELGVLRRFGGRHQDFPSFVRVSIGILQLLSVMALVLLKDAKLIHFGLLSQGRLSILARLSPDKTYHFSNNCWPYDENWLALASIGRRELDGKSDYDHNPREINYVSFDENWAPFKMARELGQTAYLIGAVRGNKEWFNFLSNKFGELLEAEKRRCNMRPQERAICVILGYFGKFQRIRSEGTVRELLIKTLRVISEEYPNTKILLKPHIITQQAILNEVLKDAGSENVHVTSLHASLLARICDVAICNSYSTAMADIWAAGVTTIEFTDYCDEALEITNGNSACPSKIDYFINNDLDQFREAVRHGISLGYKRQRSMPELYTADYERLIACFG